MLQSRSWSRNCARVRTTNDGFIAARSAAVNNGSVSGAGRPAAASASRAAASRRAKTSSRGFR